jgi:2'-hydroxyisoflavone reductase
VRTLVIGGGVFLGRHAVDIALRRGHDVTVLQRGVSSAIPPPGVRVVRGDRARDLHLVHGRRWDLVIDTCGYVPAHVAASAATLDYGCYALVSSISVYRDLDRPVDERAPVCEASSGGRLDDDTYGPLKAGCEEAVSAAGRRALIVRPGLVVGPGDLSSAARYRASEGPTHLLYDAFAGRFPYWPHRFRQGGVVAMPGTPGDPLQLLDARDLAAWVVSAGERGLAGVFNVVGTPHTWGDLAVAGLGVAPPGTTVGWIGEPALRAAGIRPHTELPMWVPSEAGWRGFYRVDASAARRQGLRCRPLAEIVRDVADWLAGVRPEDAVGTAALSAARERSLLETVA